MIKRHTLYMVMVSMLLAACGTGTAAEETETVEPVSPEVEEEAAVVATTPPTLTPSPTEAVDPYQAALRQLGEHACDLTPEVYLDRQTSINVEAAPTEDSQTDPQTGSITGTCTYEAVFSITVFIPGPEVDLEAAFQAALPADPLEIDQRDPPRLWDADGDILYVRLDDLWFSIAVLTEPEKDRLFDAVDLYGVAIQNVPENPSIATPTPLPTLVPVVFFEPCALVTADEAEAQIGPLDIAPQGAPDPEPRSGSSQTCTYYAGPNSMFANVTRFHEASLAQAEYDNLASVDGTQPVDALGEAAFWLGDVEGGGALTILQANDVLSIRIITLEADPRAAALALGRLALERLINPLPTPTPGPTPIPLNACDLMSAAEAEAIIGTLTGEPQPSASVGEGNELGPLNSQDCFYTAETGSAYVSVIQGYGSDHARAIYDSFREQATADTEDLTGLGEAAYTYSSDDYSAVVVVLDGNFVITINLSGEDPRSQALAAADIILANLP